MPELYGWFFKVSAFSSPLHVGQVSRAALVTFLVLKIKVYLRSSYKTERFRHVPQHAIKWHAGFSGLLTFFVIFICRF